MEDVRTIQQTEFAPIEFEMLDTDTIHKDVIDDVDKNLRVEDAFNLFSVDSYLQTPLKSDANKQVRLGSNIQTIRETLNL